jgi:predicted DCC family thiol-disulfide oxidoreductase YuxK
MCSRFQMALERIDIQKQINYISLHEDSIYAQFPQVSKEDCQQTIHMLLENGDVLKGPEVVEYLIGIFPGVRKFAWLLETDQGKKAVEFFYNKVNELRDKNTNLCGGCKK